MDAKLNKKLLLILVKYGSWFIGLIYLLQICLDCLGIQSVLLTFLCGNGFLPILTLIAFSIFLGFCIWHRLPLYYALTANVINLIDYYIGIPIINKWMLIIYLLLVGVFIIVGCFIKNKNNVRKRNVKESNS